MHAHEQLACTPCLVNSGVLGMSNNSVYFLLQLEIDEQQNSQQNNKQQRTKRSKFEEKEACRVRQGERRGLVQGLCTHSGRQLLLLPCGGDQSLALHGHFKPLSLRPEIVNASSSNLSHSMTTPSPNCLREFSHHESSQTVCNYERINLVLFHSVSRLGWCSSVRTI